MMLLLLSYMKDEIKARNWGQSLSGIVKELSGTFCRSRRKVLWRCPAQGWIGRPAGRVELWVDITWTRECWIGQYRPPVLSLVP